MKLQCSCGAKYSFEVTPDMANQPVHFSCPTCGMDYSEFVTNLVRQQLGSAPASAIAPPPPGYVAPPPLSIAPAPPAVGPVPAAAPVLAPIGSIRVPGASGSSSQPAAPPTPAVSQPSQPAIRIPAVSPASNTPPQPAVAPAAAAAPAPGPTRIVIPPKPVAAIAPPPTAIAPPPQLPAVAGGASIPASQSSAPKSVARIVSHPPPAAPVAAAPVLAAATVPQPAPASGLRINKETPTATAQVETPQTTAPDAPKPCFRHMGQFAVEKCYVCSKPICPKCMELFGYVCSPLCKSKAEAQGIEIPVFGGQRDVKEARSWRKTVLVTTSACSIIAAVLGVWFCTPGLVRRRTPSFPFVSANAPRRGNPHLRARIKSSSSTAAHWLAMT